MIINLSLEEILFFLDYHDIFMLKTISTNDVKGMGINFEKKLELEPPIIHSFLDKFEEAHNQKSELCIRIKYKQEPFLNFRALYENNEKGYHLFMRRLADISDNSSQNIQKENIREKVQRYLNIEKEKDLLESNLNETINSNDRIKI